MKPGFLDKLITRLDRVSPNEVQSLVSRLFREKGFLENVFEVLTEGIFIVDPEGTITFTNRSALKYFGLEDSQVSGLGLSSVIQGFDWQKLAHPERVVSRDMEVFYPENRYLNFYLAPIRGEVDSPEVELLGYVMLVRDITESKRQTEETIESEKLNALTLLAAGVAHEIGNPLNSLDIHMQLISRKLKKLPSEETEGLREHIETAQNEIRRLDSILKQFLNAVRPTSPNKSTHRLDDILQRTLKLIEVELEERQVQVSLDLSPNQPLLALDDDQIHQALYNLLRNAAQALPASGGQLNIRSDFNDYEVTLAIRDNGSGISPEMMGTLFEPYHTTKKQGSGLGLLVVRRIIREHGGEIEIDSEEELGTTVKIHLPRVEKHVRMLEQRDEHSVIDVEETS